MNKFSNLNSFPALNRVVGEIVQNWPEHEKFLAIRFGRTDIADLTLAEDMATLVLQIMGNEILDFISSYRWTCEILINEDLYFRRNGTYRWSSFQDAYREVYSDDEYMNKYLRGLLLSQVLWTNQTTAFQFYVGNFLSRLKEGSDYLEIGPGHGLLIYFAARSNRIASISGWDVSESSLKMTRKTLKDIGVSRPFTLEAHNFLNNPIITKKYDAVVLSEVMEHLDHPEVALDNILKILKPDGLAYLNVPINSPAPDHIYHWGSPDEVFDLVCSRGFSITDSLLAPATGYDVERALRSKVTINVLVIAKSAQ